MERFRIGRSTAATLAVVAVAAVSGGVAYAATQGGDGGSGQQPGAPGFAPGAAPDGGQAPEGGIPPGGPGGDCGPKGAGGPGGPPFEAAADYIGISVEDLQADLQDGKTPGEVAEDEGKSADGLRDALVESAEKRLDKAVEDGKLDSEQRDEIQGSLDERIQAFVDGERPPMPHGAPQGGPMPGGPQGGQQGQDGGNQGSSAPQAPGGAAPVTLENL